MLRQKVQEIRHRKLKPDRVRNCYWGQNQRLRFVFLCLVVLVGLEPQRILNIFWSPLSEGWVGSEPTPEMLVLWCSQVRSRCSTSGAYAVEFSTRCSVADLQSSTGPPRWVPRTSLGMLRLQSVQNFPHVLDAITAFQPPQRPI